MKIKLVVLDVDGVLTDGKKTYDKEGICVLKTFCDKDFTAIKKLKSSGVKVCFCSGDNSINELIAKNRNIDFYYSRFIDKASFVNKFKINYNCSTEEMLYVGDDIFDINLLKKVGFSVCPSDASPEVLKTCDLILKSKGGENVIVELVEYLEKNNLVDKYDYEHLLNIDADEKF